VNYLQARKFLDSLVNYERQAKPRDEFKLDNIRRLLELADNPHQRLSNVILIAGTKGKGSVAYLLDAGLRACGLSSGLYISPHLISVRERIQLNGNWIDKATFARLVAKFQPLVKRTKVSYFELLTALAFELFARRQPDYAVIEVGLGGRLDATNLSEPVLSVITKIGFDHINVLGKTLTKIAREKAGVMRSNRPVVIAPQYDEARRELLTQAQRVGAQPVLVDERSRMWDEDSSAAGLRFSCFTELGAGRVELKLLGSHQIANSLTALTTLGIIARSDPRLNFNQVVAGWSKLVIPGRCQVVAENPPLIIDSCHNPESGVALAEVIRECFRDKVILIYGSLRNKLVKRTVTPIARYVDTALVVAPDSPRALAPSVLKGLFTRLKVPAEIAPDFKTALARAQELAIGRLPIVIAGSFYLAGTALAMVKGLKSDPDAI